MKKRILLFIGMLCCLMQVSAQRFYNLTAQEVRIDSVLPSFTYQIPLDGGYADSVYTVSIAYPEFIDMTKGDIERYQKISGAELPVLPVVNQSIGVSRKQGVLEVQLCPLVYRDRRYQILVSFMLRVEAKAARRSVRKSNALTRGGTAGRYADHSVLASGRWAKIRVPSTGIYALTEELIRKAGFGNLSKVRVYGYGGALQKEVLDGNELQRLDDLKEVPTCEIDGRRLFHAQGPVSWASNTATIRIRNPYSDYGYYFITEADGDPLKVDSETFLTTFYPSADDYHELYEVDSYAWYQGGRNLFGDDPIEQGEKRAYTLTNDASVQGTAARLTVRLSAGIATTASIKVNDREMGSLRIGLSENDKGNMVAGTYEIASLTSADKVEIATTSGGPARLDFLSLTYSKPKAAPALSGVSFPEPEYVYNITNQDHHADGPADMVIIIPTSQKLLSQARRLKEFHERKDGLRVRIIPSDELFNEFGSGTPDANAYRRYLKMLYDRSSGDADMPKYLLLFGDCVWDNRLLTSDCRHLKADDLLLCFESENSFNELYCYVDDGFFCLLDDGEGGNPRSSDKLDMAVGRFPVTTEAEAKILVDKTIRYAENGNAGAWQNTLVFMGDDGNGNIHMRDINNAAEQTASLHPGYLVRKVMWDAYTRKTSATGNTYPEVTVLIKQYQANGALIMDYGGHGREDQISHELVLRLADFESFRNENLPLWITASCDIMPFDGMVSTIGERALLNAKGGAMAFFGTTRTVQSNYNKAINMAYLRHVLTVRDGRPITIGEAQMLAKNEMITSGQDNTTNKLQYSLLGDPALRLNLPTMKVVIDDINGIAEGARLKAGSIARVSGHIENGDGFNGVMTATVRDQRELITCKLNNTSDSGADTPFRYYDRTKTLFTGSDSIRNGRFTFSFAVPKDISYTDGSGLINVHAVNADHTLGAHGSTDRFTIGGSELESENTIGPSIYCYLNSPSFVNGGNVNTTPYFVAQVKDEDGINASGNGIGHDLELIIDGDMGKTYILNDHFRFDFGTYTSGSTYYNMPELAPGKHKLLFRAWDVLNNSSTTELAFNVVPGLDPNLFSVDVSQNPATTTTTFIINHDRTGSDMDVDIDVYDISGRWMWSHSESGVSTSQTYTIDWDLTTGSGRKLQTGVYVYRVRIASGGSSKVSKAKKLIVIGNN